MLAGTPDTLEGVSQAAKKAGINRGMVDEIYSRYGQNMKARALCQLLGTTPEALRDDALTIVSGTAKRSSGTGAAPSMQTTKFPRLK